MTKTEHQSNKGSASQNLRKATVRKSRDPQWNKWCVIYPDRETQWFDGENQALWAADDYNEARFGGLIIRSRKKHNSELPSVSEMRGILSDKRTAQKTAQ